METIKAETGDEFRPWINGRRNKLKVIFCDNKVDFLVFERAGVACSGPGDRDELRNFFERSRFCNLVAGILLDLDEKWSEV